MMQMTYDNPDAITAGTYPGRKEMLASCNKDLDKIEKKLEAYLETKRQAFPRYNSTFRISSINENIHLVK